jgi:hypothetical protein
MGTSPSVIMGRAYPSTQPMSVFFDEIESNVKKPDPVKYNFDPLGLTIARFAVGKTKVEVVEELSRAGSIISENGDYDQQADNIRKYYRNKLLIQSLKHTNGTMSKFRQDLQKYVNSDSPNEIDRSDVPMIVKLPDFYAEDKMMDQFEKEYVMNAKYYKKQTAYNSLTLYPMDKFHRKTKSSDSLHYWFRDDDNLVYRIELEPKNPCLHLFEREFANSSVKLDTLCNFTKTRGQTYVFYNLNKWKIL